MTHENKMKAMGFVWREARDKKTDEHLYHYWQWSQGDYEIEIAEHHIGEWWPCIIWWQYGRHSEEVKDYNDLGEYESPVQAALVAFRAIVEMYHPLVVMAQQIIKEHG